MIKNIASYGLWPSPITPEWLTHDQKKFGNIVLEGTSIYWDEVRPSEKGRSVVMQKTSDGQYIERTPKKMSCRNRVHEYGGLSFAVSNEKVYFVNEKDQRIYLETDPLTEPGIRCADIHLAGTYLVGVGEQKEQNFLFSLCLITHTLVKIAEGHDFYSSPSFSPDGKQIAYLAWNHPNMPWDETELWIGSFNKGFITNAQKAAGSQNESIFQPAWSPDGVLHCISDRTGWWNLYSFNGNSLEPLYSMEAEFGLPAWLFGMSTYAFSGNNLISCYTQGGRWSMSEVHPWRPLELRWNYYTQIQATDKTVVFIAASELEDRALICYHTESQKTEIIAHNPLPHLDSEMVSQPEMISFPSSEGRTAYGIYYPPQNKNYIGIKGTLPPLVVMSHGGPTAQVFPLFDLKIQFWTSRGFAVVNVNYGGSTGYGILYRDALKKQWGKVDVEDCEAAAQFLIAQKKVDPKRVAIRGGSAGGYTTLAALTFTRTFTVGASYYGVSDPATLLEETHKFESRYLDQLIGAYPAQQRIYEERSPLHHASQIQCPVIFFHGAEDLVVPVNQAEMMYTALKSKEIETELIIYPDEQHGFRKAENIKDSLNRELQFYLKAWKGN